MAVLSQPRTAVFPHQKGEQSATLRASSIFFSSSAAEDVFALLPAGFLPRDGDKLSAGIEAPQRGQRREPDVSLRSSGGSSAAKMSDGSIQVLFCLQLTGPFPPNVVLGFFYWMDTRNKCIEN